MVTTSGHALILALSTAETDSRNIKPRLGAVGKHRSISVTKRVIKTLKYEWLKRVSLIRGFDHLVVLCEEFEDWY